MPLTAWLGWTQSPGDVPGYGPLDADDSRTLAGLLAQDPGSQWCATLTGHAGHPVAHACAPHGPPGSPPRPAIPHEQPNPRGPNRGDQPSPGDQPNPAPPDPARPEGGPDPRAPVPDWLRGLSFTTL